MAARGGVGCVVKEGPIECMQLQGVSSEIFWRCSLLGRYGMVEFSLKSLEFSNQWDFRMVSAWDFKILPYSAVPVIPKPFGGRSQGVKVSIDFVTNLLLEIPD